MHGASPPLGLDTRQVRDSAKKVVRRNADRRPKTMPATSRTANSRSIMCTHDLSAATRTTLRYKNVHVAGKNHTATGKTLTAAKNSMPHDMGGWHIARCGTEMCLRQEKTTARQEKRWLRLKISCRTRWGDGLVW